MVSGQTMRKSLSAGIGVVRRGESRNPPQMHCRLLKHSSRRTYLGHVERDDPAHSTRRDRSDRGMTGRLRGGQARWVVPTNRHVVSHAPLSSGDPAAEPRAACLSYTVTSIVARMSYEVAAQTTCPDDRNE